MNDVPFAGGALAADVDHPAGVPARTGEPDTAQHYSSSSEHLFAELERLDLLIRAEVAHVRKLQSQDEQFRGLYVSEQDVDELLQQPLGRPHWLMRRDSRPPGLDLKLQSLRAAIGQRKRESAQRGVVLRLEALQRTFGLTDFDVDALLVCLAVELDLRYERLYAYLQDDVTKKRPSVDLVLNLLSPSIEQKLSDRERFAPHAPLMRHAVLERIDDAGQARPPLLAQPLKVNDRIVDYLLGSDEPDERIRTFVTRAGASAALPELYLDEPTRRGLYGLAARARRAERLIVHLRGRRGVGKQAIAGAVCGEAGRALLIADLEKMLSASEPAFGSNTALIRREAQLCNAALYWRGYDVLLTDAHRARLPQFLSVCAEGLDLVFLSGERTWHPAESLPGISLTRIELPVPDHEARSKLWASALHEIGGQGRPVDVSSLASKFKFTAGDIRSAVAAGKGLAQWRNAESPLITTADLYEASRLHSNQGLAVLASKITPKYRWDDIVLPPERVAQLREICNHVKYRELVYGKWGFGRKLALGKGIAALFAGPSGTGKTMAADIIAGELGLDLYKVDLATVVSKYIGETEKNLARIFGEAETSNAVLFFDEADALFGKRSEVRDSHDRYANIEIGYLLQRMEEYEGIVILATNLRKNMDEAFVRRLQVTVDFPFPNEEERRRIWANIWPEDLPRDPRLDLDLLARRLEITGGNIRNIAVSAAFLAAEDGGSVRMDHVALATDREYQKMGKLVSHDELRIRHEADARAGERPSAPGES